MIILKNISKIYDSNGDKTVALDDVNLEINDGEIIAVIGESGSGKSTLLNILGCMDNASSGEYIFDGINVETLSVGEFHDFRKNHISFVFQNFALLNNYSVSENVEVPLLAKRIHKKERKEIVFDSLKKVGMEKYLKKNVSKLSGGQQQRIAIARALAANNSLILADEPTGALDNKNTDSLMELFKELNKEGKTIVIVTHSTKVAEKCDRIVRIEDGKLV